MNGTLTPQPQNPDWFERLPKVELHLHLEGAIPFPSLWELVQKYGGDPQVPDMQALNQKFAYRDFAHFIETWIWKNGFLRSYDDFTLIAEGAARDLASQNIRYVEAFYSPVDFTRHGLKTQELTRAIRAGLAKVPQIEVALVADLVRSTPPEQADRNLSELNEVRDLGVIGIGLGGAESQYPPEPFKEVYARARALGFHTSAHAGEAAGADSIWGAVRELQVERIGHATRAGEDPVLLDYLAEKQLPLEMCPLSNLRTGVVTSLEAHPVRRFFERGLLVTINTDDPKMFGNSLAQEYRLLESRLGFSRAEICGLIENGIRCSWLAPERKATLLREFSQSADWLPAAG